MRVSNKFNNSTFYKEKTEGEVTIDIAEDDKSVNKDLSILGNYVEYEDVKNEKSN